MTSRGGWVASHHARERMAEKGCGQVPFGRHAVSERRVEAWKAGTVLILLLAGTLTASCGAIAGPGESVEVPSGEVLVLTGDAALSGTYIVHGEMRLDAANVATDALGAAIEVLPQGSLLVTNGSLVTGGTLRVNCSSAGRVTIMDSVLEGIAGETGRWGLNSTGSLVVERSTLRGDRRLLRALGGSVHINGSSIEATSGSQGPDASLELEGLDPVGLRDVNLVSLGAAVRVARSANVTVARCAIAPGAGRALELVAVDSPVVSGCNLSGGEVGARLFGCPSASVSDCDVEGCTVGALDINTSHGASLTGLRLRECGRWGLNLSFSGDASVRGLDITDLSPGGYGAWTWECPSLALADVTVRGCEVGLELIYTNASRVSNVTVEDCSQYALGMSKCSPIEVEGFVAEDTGVDGLYARFCGILIVRNGSLDGAAECGAFVTHCALTMSNVSMSRCGLYGLRAALNSAFLTRCNLSWNGRGGMLSLDQGGAGVSRSTLEHNGGDAIELLNTQKAKILDSRISWNAGAGVRAHSMSQGTSLDGCNLEGNAFGLVLNGVSNLTVGATMTARDTWIHNSTVAGALSRFSGEALDARYCWWGNNTGPSNDTANPAGHGDNIWGNVLFRPWLKVGNLDPSVSGPSQVSALEGQTLMAIYEAHDLDNDDSTLTFAVEGAPPNITMDERTGVLGGVPEDDAVGVHAMSVVVRDPEGGSARLPVELTVRSVNDDPVVCPVGPLSVLEDLTLELRLEARDVDSDPAGFLWSLASGPEWFEVLPDGSVIARPLDGMAGVYSVVVRVDDGDGGHGVAVLELVVYPYYDPLDVQPTSLPLAYEDAPYKASLQVWCDEEAELNWSISTEATWLRFLVDSATFLGTPEQADVGTWHVVVLVSDQWGSVCERPYEIQVLPVNDPPAWTGAPAEVRVSTEEHRLELAPFLSDPDDPVGALELTTDDPRCRFEGTVLVLSRGAGDVDSEVTLRAVDPDGLSAVHVLRVDVDFPPEPGPVFKVGGPGLLWVVMALVVLAIAAAVVLRYSPWRVGRR